MIGNSLLRFRYLASVLALLLAFLGGMGVQRVLAHDANLDLTLVALEKATGLIQLALTNNDTNPSDKARHDVAKHLERALNDIADASEEIDLAAAIQDTP
jgi:hypothetical protein